MMHRSYQPAEAEANHRAMLGGACAVWQHGQSFTVWPCGEDHPGEIAYLIIPID
jgi:hypothetical protein